MTIGAPCFLPGSTPKQEIDCPGADSSGVTGSKQSGAIGERNFSCILSKVAIPLTLLLSWVLGILFLSLASRFSPRHDLSSEPSCLEAEPAR
jgi:hypothetical protein